MSQARVFPRATSSTRSTVALSGTSGLVSHDRIARRDNAIGAFANARASVGSSAPANSFNKSSSSSKRGEKHSNSSNSSNGNGNGELIDYNFKANTEPDNSLKELNMDMDLGLKYNDFIVF